MEGTPMNMTQLPKAYNPKDFEDRIYQMWKDEGLFKPAGDKGKDPFVIAMPPPNVTGVLHVGHGLNNSLQDILVRYYRMLGRPTLWVPGTDHAGIATQQVVEKRLQKIGLGRRKMSREDFIKETWKVKDEHHSIIVRQLEKIGASCDWSRERFTMDDGLSGAVREIFVNLFEKGLIYRGEYLVNWCSSCGTALSDDEVEHEEKNGAMYHIRYPWSDGSGFIEIATTRPETMLGDVAVAFHPDDERYRSLAGKTLRLPLVDREIPLIADTYVDREFGTGLVKITPGHDPNDFEIGRRHDLPIINILRADGKLNDEVPERFRGLTVSEARERVISELKEEGLFVEEKAIVHALGHCYRCHNTVEPFMSEQWFVKMKPMAEKALKVWKDGHIRFYPQRWEKTYEHWLVNIRDWCISRQLWWGHRIPVWYCDKCSWYGAFREEPGKCPECGSGELRQDEDVLDTWFSSWIWPFSIMGWPGKTDDLAAFYPTTALVTGYDIIFFWVARMIMAGMEFTGQAPFSDVFLTTMVRDRQGRIMSKSLGNGVDPLEIVDEYGADALKFTLAFLTSQGQDLHLDTESFKLGSRFANKIWNAARYILMNLEDIELIENPELKEVDKWIYHRLNEAISLTSQAMDAYRFNDASASVYEFFWNEFCDWYLEATKLSTRSGEKEERNRAMSVLVNLLEESLRLLHPFLPFLTEEIYGNLPNRKGRLMVQPYPKTDSARIDRTIDENFASLKELVTLVRVLKAEFGIAQEKKLRLAAKADSELAAFFKNNTGLVKLLANAEAFSIEAGKPEESLALAGKRFECYVFAREAVDTVALAERFRKDVEKDRVWAEKLEKKLANEGFVKSAPAEVIASERQKLDATRAKVVKLEAWLKELS